MKGAVMRWLSESTQHVRAYSGLCPFDLQIARWIPS